jgi:histidine triad (HIT) family protein
VTQLKRTCAFCGIAAGELAANIVHRDAQVLAFLDRSPLFLGHTLVMPIAHVETLDDLAPEQIGPLFDVVRRTSIAVQAACGADGSFVAANTRVSQSVPHVHVHVVPRKTGDGFFSPRPIWRRQAYASDAEAAEYAAKIRAAFPGADSR